MNEFYSLLIFISGYSKCMADSLQRKDAAQCFIQRTTALPFAVVLPIAGQVPERLLGISHGCDRWYHEVPVLGGMEITATASGSWRCVCSLCHAIRSL